MGRSVGASPTWRCTKCHEERARADFYFKRDHDRRWPRLIPPCRICKASAAKADRAAARAAGKTRWIPDERLLTNLRSVCERLGGRPSHGIFDALPKAIRVVTRGCYQKHFGSLTRAYTLAGLDHLPRISNRSSDWGSKGYAGRVHSRRTRATGKLSSGLRFRVLARDGFRCVYCGCSPRDGAVLAVDHLLPVASGGLTESENLVTACLECNSGKQDLILTLDHMLTIRARRDAFDTPDCHRQPPVFRPLGAALTPDDMSPRQAQGHTDPYPVVRVGDSVKTPGES